MYFKLANQTVILQGTSQYSQAFDMQGANQALVDIEVINISGGGSKRVEVTLQEGNDLENWRDVVASPSMTAIGYYQLKTTEGLASQYVRLKFVVTGIANDMAIVSAGIDTADL